MIDKGYAVPIGQSVFNVIDGNIKAFAYEPRDLRSISCKMYDRIAHFQNKGVFATADLVRSNIKIGKNKKSLLHAS
jgi:hypothetical protein